MNRYIECSESLVQVFLEVMEERFPSFQNLKIKLIFDTKKRKRNGKVVLASIEIANDKLRFFSKDNVAIEGYDYVLIVDALAWELSSDIDKRRLISHELRHVFIDENGSCKLVGHDITDFYAEMELNKDEPRWADNLVTIVADVYDQKKENNGELK